MLVCNDEGLIVKEYENDEIITMEIHEVSVEELHIERNWVSE